MINGTFLQTIARTTQRLMWLQHSRSAQPARHAFLEHGGACAQVMPAGAHAVHTGTAERMRRPQQHGSSRYPRQTAVLGYCTPHLLCPKPAPARPCLGHMQLHVGSGRPGTKSILCQSAASATAVFPPDANGSHNGSCNGSTGPAEYVRQYSPEVQVAKPLVMTADEQDQMKRELHSLNVAISVNLLICLAKVWVHLISGSSAMLAEALHSVADILNQVLLRVGVVAAMKAPTVRHPYGYMRDRFVWSLISAVGIFFLGAGASVLHGLHTLAETTRVVEAATWSYVVLGVSALLEGYSLWVAVRCVMAGARARGMPLLPYIMSGVDPTTVAVMLEDGGAVAGLLIAGVCTGLTHMTGDAMWDAVGSIAVGGLLGLIATFLVQKNRDLLLGRSMSRNETEEVLSHLRQDPVVSFVTDTKTEELGPRVFRFKAEVGWDGDALVDRYLRRSGPLGRDRLVASLEAALAAERAARSVGGTSRALDLVLRGYGRDIISSVGMEVDRIEAEIQKINPGIRYVDLETDRGRASSWVTAAPGPAAAAAAGSGTAISTASSGSASSGEGEGEEVRPLSPAAAAAGAPAEGEGSPDAGSGAARRDAV